MPDTAQAKPISQAPAQDMLKLIRDLYPLCRSITGEGVRQTLDRIGRLIPLTVHSVPSGTPVFDWVVPREWNIRDAYIKDRSGRRLVDFRASNLHVLNYSIPLNCCKMPFSRLKEHLHTLPDQPDWIPYRTSYYAEDWGFCLSEKQLQQFCEDEEYEVCIDSTLEPGVLNYGEHFLRGREEDEVLISCHICHPSLCNDNLSGIAVAAFLADMLTGRKLRYSYRFLFIPGTIGSITWLALNEEKVPSIRHGLVLSCLGDPGPSTYKRSRRGDAEIDRVASHVLRHSGCPHQIMEFTPYGYDERQYCSPGFNLPVGCLSRSTHGSFPEYHTSADNLDLLRADALEDSLEKCLTIVQVLEDNHTLLNRNPKCEPQLGKRGLFRSVGGSTPVDQMALLWILNLSDGQHSLLDIAEKADMEFSAIRRAADALLECELLEAMESRQ